MDAIIDTAWKAVSYTHLYKAADPHEQQALLRKAAQWFKLAASEEKPTQH